jgi:GTP-binding protein
MVRPQDIRFLRGAVWPDRYPPERLPEVAFVGRSNVGKSSLINALVRRKGLARTSQSPGKSQLIHFYQVNDHFVLVDLPGYGYARVSEEIRRRWRPMVEQYMISRGTLCLVVFLLDFRRDPSHLDVQLKRWLDHHAKPYIVVPTKADKIPRGKRLLQMRRIAEGLDIPVEDLILFSAVRQEGHRVLWRHITGAVDGFVSQIKP